MISRILPLKRSRFAWRAVRWKSPLKRIVVDVPVDGGGHIVAIFLPLKDWAAGLVAKEWTTTVVDRGLSPGDGSAAEINWNYPREGLRSTSCRTADSAVGFSRSGFQRRYFQHTDLIDKIDNFVWA